MKHKIKVQVPIEKRGLLGFKRTVMTTQIVEVDSRTYKRMKNENTSRPYSIEEMMLYDDLFDED